MANLLIQCKTCQEWLDVKDSNFDIQNNEVCICVYCDICDRELEETISINSN
jgi:hypothetical protein